MTFNRPIAFAAAAAIAVASCSPPAPQPTPAPPSPRPASSGERSVAAITLPAPAPAANWVDAPQSPGDWTYTRVNGGTLVRFGTGERQVFGIGCMSGTNRIVLLRYGAAADGDTPMTVRTETADRTFATKPATGGEGISTALQPRDPILDAMAFSKGRFAVETQGMPTLYLPSWPEVTRVIEDCR